jgi:hypothetical protein
MSITSSRKPLHFARNVGAGSSGEDSHKLSRDATIERVMTRFYAGQELDLRINLWLEKKDGDKRIPIVETTGSTGSKSHIAGDDDDYEWTPAIRAEQGDKIIVDYDNTDATNAYDYVVNMDVDRMNGMRRAFEWLKELIG